jgi:hypothetical protein
MLIGFVSSSAPQESAAAGLIGALRAAIVVLWYANTDLPDDRRG